LDCWPLYSSGSAPAVNSIKANKAIPEAQKREDLAQLEAALKEARPIQFEENIAMVLKYFDQLPPLYQEEGPASPANLPSSKEPDRDTKPFAERMVADHQKIERIEVLGRERQGQGDPAYGTS
jgi:hypothetical protein